ncbi:unnamed protein product [Spirodela intermedia]|uniref:Uncharacterized protein n=1 Tax=Spirodela intermedia TaxID=51605 RepID=A0A7I8IEY9_SPIIN|nr:unnamed protein product [Spirodela intermedia]CAA6656368.1 unnamed protein product [Spirodela intermedia]
MEILGCRGSSYGLPSRKKARLLAYLPSFPVAVEAAAAPTSITRETKKDLFETLPDECIQHIFTFLPSPRDRCSCAAVSRRWLHLQAHMKSSDFPPAATAPTAPSFILTDEDDDKVNDARLASLAGRRPQPPSGSSLLAITDMGLKVVSQACAELRRLTLWECHKVGREGLATIAGACPKLEELHISRSSLVDDGALIPFAVNCPKLSLLSLDRCPMPLPVGDRRGPRRHLLLLPKLAKITISHMSAGDGALAAVGASSGGNSPKHVAICGCGAFTDRGLARLSNAAGKLETLRLEKCHAVTTEGLLMALKNWSTTLKSLSLVKCDGVGNLPEGKETTAAALLRKLQTLEINKCPRAGDEFLRLLAAAMPRLKRITLAAMDAVSDRGFISLLASLERPHAVSSMDLSGSKGITDRSVAALASAAGRSLSSLSLEGCERVTDRSLAFLGLLCPRLLELDLTNCRQISDSGVAALARRACVGGGTEKNGLEMLSLEGCEGVTDESLLKLEEMADEGKLVSLNLKRCRRLSPAGVDAIHQHLWWCDLIY